MTMHFMKTLRRNTKRSQKISSLIGTSINVMNIIIIMACLCSVSWIEIFGMRYKIGSIIIHKSELMPGFTKIIDIVMINPTLSYFICTEYETLYFSHHYHAYVVHECPSNIHIIQYSDFIDHNVFTTHNIDDTLYIPMKYHIIENI